MRLNPVAIGLALAVSFSASVSFAGLTASTSTKPATGISKTGVTVGGSSTSGSMTQASRESVAKLKSLWQSWSKAVDKLRRQMDDAKDERAKLCKWGEAAARVFRTNPKSFRGLMHPLCIDGAPTGRPSENATQGN